MVEICRVLIVATLLASGCATASGQPDRADSSADSADGPVDTSSRFGFMGLNDGPLEADWEEWTPTESLAAPTTSPFIAFESWTLTDATESEQLWASSFSLLDASRSYLPGEAGPTVRALMTLLDPGSNPGEVTTDVVFIVGADLATEGVLFRTYRKMPNGGTLGLVLELRRAAGGSDLPTEVVLHLHSGYAEAPSYRVDFGDGDVLKWARAKPDAPWRIVRSEGLNRELSVTRDIVEATFWRPTIGTAYIEPIWTIERSSDGGDGAPPGFPAGHGADVDLRPIDAVLVDTVFPPRLDLKSPSN